MAAARFPYSRRRRRLCCGGNLKGVLMRRWKNCNRCSRPTAKPLPVCPRFPGAYTCSTSRGKKSLIASERDEKVRKKFRKLTNSLASEDFVFIDEMGSHRGLTRLYGRAAPGQRVLDQVPGDRGGNVSTIGALSLAGMRTGLSVPGAIDGATMLFFVEELLVPTLKRGDIGVMDNNPIHKLEEIEDAIEAAGAWVLFLPTYSPDLNPIELCWSKIKSCLRSLKPRTLPDLLDALGYAFSSITQSDIRHWFQHCGYQVASTRKSL
jgi:transposase